MSEDWVAAEVDRRIHLMEAETGGKIPRKRRREIERRMRRGMARGTRRVKDAATEDRESAVRHGLAKELKRAGVVPEAVYLRMGGLPEGCDSASANREAGARSKAVFGYEEDGQWLRSSLIRFCKEEAREAYLIEGRCAGKGSDGEPLLSAVEGVEPLGAEKVLACEPSSRALEEWNDRRGA